MSVDRSRFQVWAFRPLSRRVTRPLSYVALVAWVACMGVLAQRAYLLAPSAQTADTLGWILVQQSKADRGAALLRRAAALQPGDQTIQYHLAAALQATGHHDDAVRVLDTLLAKPGEFDDRDAAQRLRDELAARPVPK